LDNVVTSTIAFEGDAQWREFEGGVTDWLVQSKRANEIAQAKGQKTAAPFHYGRQSANEVTAPGRLAADTAPCAKAQNAPAPVDAAAAKTKKLSYKEQRERDALPAQIAALEAEQKSIADVLADGSLYAHDSARARALAERNAVVDDALLQALMRLDALGG
jgi:ATP-binding cassette subfamily F protein uup